jgi:hypothetical protein
MHILTYIYIYDLIMCSFLSRHDPDITIPVTAHLASSAPCLGIICMV